LNQVSRADEGTNIVESLLACFGTIFKCSSRPSEAEARPDGALDNPLYVFPFNQIIFYIKPFLHPSPGPSFLEMMERDNLHRNEERSHSNRSCCDCNTHFVIARNSTSRETISLYVSSIFMHHHMRTPCPRTINKKICYQIVASCWIFYFCMHFVTRKILKTKKGI
jgi:hypothetical protein